MWIFQINLRSAYDVHVPNFIINMLCSVGLVWSGLGVILVMPCFGLGLDLVSIPQSHGHDLILIQFGLGHDLASDKVVLTRVPAKNHQIIF